MKDSFYQALGRVSSGEISKEDILLLLTEEGREEEALLFARARETRDKYVGRRMAVRGLVEFSSYCKGTCSYCGLHRDNRKAKRYRLSVEEILASAERIAEAGVGTIVLQSGEVDNDPKRLADCMEKIKSRWNLAITLSLGERSREDYALWKSSGADRYLLRIETSDPDLYRNLHNGRELSTRIACLEALRAEGYQVGSGIMVGVPGQTLAHIAEDILFLKDYSQDMVGIGPFIPHPETIHRGAPAGDVYLTFRTLAVLRLLIPWVWMPATTALGSLDRDYRADALNAGANVLMPNFSPPRAKELYEIYPDKCCLHEQGGENIQSIFSLAKVAQLEPDFSPAHSLSPDFAGLIGVSGLR